MRADWLYTVKNYGRESASLGYKYIYSVHIVAP